MGRACTMQLNCCMSFMYSAGQRSLLRNRRDKQITYDQDRRHRSRASASTDIHLQYLPFIDAPPHHGTASKRGSRMFRIFAIGLGGILVALGVIWFFTSLLDVLLLSLAGPLAKNGVTSMSKMSLGDNISLLFAGLTITGAGLMALGLFTSLSGREKADKGASKAD